MTRRILIRYTDGTSRVYGFDSSDEAIEFVASEGDHVYDWEWLS